MNTNNIAAVVVTYNRAELLIECLGALRAQTHPVSKIIIVNNSSTDSTVELLVENGYLEANYKEGEFSNKFENKNRSYNYLISSKINHNIECIYVEIDTNSGGAGGFYLGQFLAIENGADWVWMMDDDGRPASDCLELLLSAASLNKMMVLNPLVINIDGSERLSFGLSGKIKTVSDAIRYQDQLGLIEYKANPFNGTLLNKSILQNQGLVKSEMFIWGDEAEYFLRLKKANVYYATVVSAKFFHPESKTIFKKALFGLMKLSLKPEILEMNAYRNLGFINANYKKRSSHRVLIKLCIYFLLNKQWEKVPMVWRYYMDGVENTFKLPHFLKSRN